MFNYFTIHSKKIQFASLKTEAEVWAGIQSKSSTKIMKTKGKFFKDLLPGEYNRIFN